MLCECSEEQENSSSLDRQGIWGGGVGGAKEMELP